MMAKKKNNNANGGKVRAEKLTPEQRSEIAKKSANVRWSKKPANHASRIATLEKAVEEITPMLSEWKRNKELEAKKNRIYDKEMK